MTAPPTGDTNAIWRAVVESATATLPEGPDRQAKAWKIAEAALARLEAAPARRWVGTIGDPCWICSRPHGEHLDGRCPTPSAPTAALDALIAAFRALGHGIDRVSFAEHGGWLHVSVQTSDTAGADAVARICELLGAPPAEQASDNGYTWLRSKIERGPEMTITITGNWQARARSAAT